jgi:hypothetical protein
VEKGGDPKETHPQKFELRSLKRTNQRFPRALPARSKQNNKTEIKLRTPSASTRAQLAPWGMSE